MPDQRMTADLLVVLPGEGNQPVGFREVELPPLGLHDLPLHYVLRSDTVELFSGQPSVGAVVGQCRGVDSRTDSNSSWFGQLAQCGGARIHDAGGVCRRGTAGKESAGQGGGQNRAESDAPKRHKGSSDEVDGMEVGGNHGTAQEVPLWDVASPAGQAGE